MRLLLLTLSLAALAITIALAQSVLNPSPLAAVCAYSTSPPTVSTGSFVYVQCNSTGSLLLH